MSTHLHSHFHNSFSKHYKGEPVNLHTFECGLFLSYTCHILKSFTSLQYTFYKTFLKLSPGSLNQLGTVSEYFLNILGKLGRIIPLFVISIKLLIF